MLRKLIKYEFKATSGLILPMYGLLIALAVVLSVGLAFNLDEFIARASSELQSGGVVIAVFGFILLTLFVILTVVVLSGMFFYSAKRFKDNLLGSEGYLMHTLPVKVRDHILAKCTVSVIWTAASIFAAGVAYLILMLGMAETSIFKAIWTVLSRLENINPKPIFSMNFGVSAIEFLLCWIVSVDALYLRIYASLSVGYSFNSHRFLKSILTFICLTIVTNIAETLITTPLIRFAGYSVYFNNFQFTLLFGIIVNALCGAAYYFITHFFLSKRLNLQ